MSPDPDIEVLIPGFLDEIEHRLEAIDRDVEALARHAEGPEEIGRVYAALHTVKGSASCLSLKNLAEAAHRAESILEPWRGTRAAIDADTIAALRKALDDLRALRETLSLGAAPTRHVEMAARRVALVDVFRHHATLARGRAREAGDDVIVRIDVDPDLALDRHAVRDLSPAILHTLSNCVDHAVQSPEMRAAAGKPARTQIVLAAEVGADGSLCIRVSDDGRGLDRRAIARRAVALGMADHDDAERLDDDTIHRLIMRAGLSTDESPSLRTGRGVGLDAVRRSVAGLGGAVEVASREGEGTTVAFRFPSVNRLSSSADTSTGVQPRRTT